MRNRTLITVILLCLLISLSACDIKYDTQLTVNKAEVVEVIDSTDDAENISEEVSSEMEAAGIYDTLIIDTESFNGIFSPMFANNAYDVQAFDPIFTSVSRLDADGNLQDYAGHVSAEKFTADDGHTQMLYMITLKEGMVFSDGEPITIDDIIFYYYVTADPTYDGSSTFSTLDIVGMKEYYYDSTDYAKQLGNIASDVESKYALDKISEEDYKAYLSNSNLEGRWTGISNEDLVQYLKYQGYDPTGIETEKEKLFDMLINCEYDNNYEEYNPQFYYQTKFEQDFIFRNLEDGIDVPTITGITRVDDYTCTVLFDSINIYGDRDLADLSIVPEHYYGKDFVKGDLSDVKALNSKPLGSGPYTFVSYEDNIVTLEANPLYFDEVAKIPYIKYVVESETDKVNAVISGNIDIANPDASLNVLEQIKSSGLEYSLVENAGFGYISISAENVPDINVRKGLMHLMNRAPAVESYYGELGQVIERPMTPTLKEYPEEAKEVYGYDTSRAFEYFTTAGYMKDKSGKLVKDGEQLRIVVGIDGDGKLDHPCASILTQMADDMKAMGAELIIQDIDFAALVNMKDSGELDMWVMAWCNSTTCDLTQVFGSKGNDNSVKYYSEEIDELQSKILITTDIEERSALVAKELDLIMDAAVCMPVYQRKNMEIYNSQKINTESLPDVTTIYWNYANKINKLELY